MNKLFKFLMLFLIPAALVMSCKDDEDNGAAGPPSITAVDPEQVFPGEQVTLTGTNLGTTSRVSLGVDQVQFDATPTTITFTVPAGTEPGETTVTVVNPSGNTTTNLIIMREAGPPQVTGLSRYHVAPGDELILVGENLIDIQTLQIGGANVEVNDIHTVETTDTLRFTVPTAITESGTIHIVTVHGEITTQQEVQVWGNTVLISDFDGGGIRPTWNHAGAMEEPEVRSTTPPVPLFGNYLHFQSIPVEEAAGRGFAMVQPDQPEGGHQPYPFDNTDAANINLSFWANPGAGQDVTLQIIISTNDPERDIYAAYRDLESGWENFVINLDEFGLGYGAADIVDDADRLNPARVVQVDFRFIPSNFQERRQIANVDNVMFVEE